MTKDVLQIEIICISIYTGFFYVNILALLIRGLVSMAAKEANDDGPVPDYTDNILKGEVEHIINDPEVISKVLTILVAKKLVRTE